MLDTAQKTAQCAEKYTLNKKRYIVFGSTAPFEEEPTDRLTSFDVDAVVLPPARDRVTSF